MNGLLGPVTANRNMLAQALKSRQKGPMELKPVTPQGLLDNAAMATSPVPLLGDVLGLAADANRFYNEPESRTPLNFGLAALGLIPFLPPLVSAGLGKFAQSQGKTLGQLPTGPARNQAGAIVYHGSPHRFEPTPESPLGKFDSSKIGTGEGAQAYGHGLYFAENPKVAQGYSMMGDYFVNMNGKQIDASLTKNTYNDSASQAERYAANAFMRFNGDKKQAIEFLSQPGNMRAEKEGAAILKKNKDINISGGSLYKVDLPDEAIAKMLDWDKPLSQQPELTKVLKERGVTFDPNQTGQQFYYRQKSGDGHWSASPAAGQSAADAKWLSGMGVPGVRYLDGGSRGAGEGTSNFVVFPGNEGLLKILGRE